MILGIIIFLISFMILLGIIFLIIRYVKPLKDLKNKYEQAEQELVEATRQKNQMETILLHMTDGLIAFNVDEEIIHINPAAKKLLKIENEKTFSEIFSKYEDINLEKNYNVAVPKGSSITIDGIKVDKKYLLKDNNKYKGLDLYELPVILSGTHKLSLVINKEIVTKKIDTEKLIKLNDIIQITKDDLSDESIEELNKRVEESLTSIMNDLTQTEQIVITNDYSKYVDEKHLQEIFEDKREDLLKDNKELTNFKITNTLLSNVSVDKKGIVLRYLFTYEYETDKKHVFANYIKVYLDSDLKIIDINRLP